MNDKIKRFEQAIERRQDRQLAMFWNEIEPELTKDNDYIADLELQILQREYMMQRIAENQRWINIARNTLKQAQAWQLGSLQNRNTSE